MSRFIDADILADDLCELAKKTDYIVDISAVGRLIDKQLTVIDLSEVQRQLGILSEEFEKRKEEATDEAEKEKCRVARRALIVAGDIVEENLLEEYSRKGENYYKKRCDKLLDLCEEFSIIAHDYSKQIEELLKIADKESED